MKTRLNYNGGNAEGRMIKDKERSLKKALLYSYQAATAILEDGREFRCLINPNKNKPEYDNKIHRLLTETIWKEITVSPPNITKDKKLNDTYSATWEVRIPLGYKHEAKNIYKSCCKYIEVKK